MRQKLRLLTFNMQAGIATQSYAQYITRAHHQVFRAAPKRRVLLAIADLISDYDIVCLQEVDLGGRRAGFVSQVLSLLENSAHSYAAIQENRVIGKISKHGNATLSRFPIREFHDIKLPGRMPGRGCLISTIEIGNNVLTAANLHLSLGPTTQEQQLDHIASCLDEKHPIIVAGDFNCASNSGPVLEFSRKTNCTPPKSTSILTYPSWKPRKSYDHILTSDNLDVRSYTSVSSRLSDHLPVGAEIAVTGRRSNTKAKAILTD